MMSVPVFIIQWQWSASSCPHSCPRRRIAVPGPHNRRPRTIQQGPQDDTIRAPSSNNSSHRTTQRLLQDQIREHRNQGATNRTTTTPAPGPHIIYHRRTQQLPQDQTTSFRTIQQLPQDNRRSGPHNSCPRTTGGQDHITDTSEAHNSCSQDHATSVSSNSSKVWQTSCLMSISTCQTEIWDEQPSRLVPWCWWRGRILIKSITAAITFPESNFTANHTPGVLWPLRFWGFPTNELIIICENESSCESQDDPCLLFWVTC